MKYKVIFIADKILPHSAELLKALANDYRLFTSALPDEYQQVFLQSGKFLVFFSDTANAVKFRQKFAVELRGVDFEIVSYLHTNSKFKPESQKIIDDNRIKLFPLGQIVELKQFLAKYFVETNDELDLEFISSFPESTEPQAKD